MRSATAMAGKTPRWRGRAEHSSEPLSKGMARRGRARPSKGKANSSREFFD